MEIYEQIKAYRPWNEQERQDQVLILDFLRKNSDAFYRTNLLAHMTASAWVVNPQRSKVLMVYHRLYDSWSWDCLLYTSPSPRDQSLSRMPSSA